MQKIELKNLQELCQNLDFFQDSDWFGENGLSGDLEAVFGDVVFQRSLLLCLAVFLLKVKAYFVRKKLIDFLLTCLNSSITLKIPFSAPFSALQLFYGRCGTEKFAKNKKILPKLTKTEGNLLLEIFPRAVAFARLLQIAVSVG